MRALAAHTRRRLLDEAIVDLLRARALHDDALALVENSLAGHPKAARYDGHVDQTPRLWCFTHERDHRRCQHDGLACGGTPVLAVDPTGDAATSPDAAAVALRLIDQTVAAIAIVTRLLATEVVAWSPHAPASATVRPDPSAVTALPGWCRNCWSHGYRNGPIPPRPGGTSPYYAELCEWCGRFDSVHGRLPGAELLRNHHSKTRRGDDPAVAHF